MDPDSKLFRTKVRILYGNSEMGCARKELFLLFDMFKLPSNICTMSGSKAGFGRSIQESLLDPYPDSYHSKATLDTDRRRFEGNLKYLFLSITEKLSIFHIF